MGKQTKKVQAKIISNKILLLIFLIGFALRLVMIGNIPGNTSIYQDEAFAAYESYSMLNYGTDSHGYVFPVYLKTWGSGMSIMQSLCMMPFIAIFGLNSFSARLPQGILGCLTLVAFYFLYKRLRCKKEAILATFIFAIIPWHVMMSRWALDCNYFPAFLLFGMLFLLKSEDNPKWLVLSAFFYGCSLYCYAAAWVVMPIMLLISFIYLRHKKVVTLNKYSVISFLILALMATPLLLFVAVNAGIIPEIRTNIISIPKLSHFRGDDVSLSAKLVLQRFYETFVMFVNQDDGRISNAPTNFGLYYKFSNIFIIIGIASSIYDIFKKKEHSNDIVVFSQLIAGIILGGLIEVVFNRINIIHIPMIYFLCVGLWTVIEFFGDKILYAIIGLYSFSAIAFASYYVTVHDDFIAQVNYDGITTALQALQEEDIDTVHILSTSELKHAYILYSVAYPTDLYKETVVFKDVNAIAMDPLYFEGYDYTATTSDTPVSGDAYVCVDTDIDSTQYMQDNDMEITYYNHVVVGIAK